MDVVEQPPAIDLQSAESAPAEEESLAAHEQSFGDNPRPAPAADDEPAPPREKHRAKSQQADVEDVAQIATLTRQLREKEAELVKIKPDALKGSPRLRTLQRQIAAIEAELTPKAAVVEPPKVTPQPVRQPQPQRVPQAASAFTEPKPKIEDFASEEDPYEAKVVATARWQMRKEAWEYHQAQQAHAQEAGRIAGLAEKTRIANAHEQRMKTFAATKPDWDTVTAPMMERMIPNALLAALISADNGPALVYHLSQHPDQLDEMHLLADGKDPSDEFVALLQRRLNTRLQAVTTGAAVPSLPQPPAPRPPTPVRTGPMHTGSEPPGDDSSLAEHEKYYGPKRRR